jgi:hypothetical protein
MTSIILQKEVQQYISHADDRFLRMVYSLAREYSKHDDKVLGYQIGKPIEKSQLLADLLEAEKQIERGEYITIDDLEKESEAW